MEVPREIRGLVDQLGQAMAYAVMADENGRNLIQQIQESGFDVGVWLEATVALSHRDSEDCGDMRERNSSAINFFTESDEHCEPPNPGDLEWSEEDKAMLCNFRISLD